jgi:uncharacterized membrane protein
MSARRHASSPHDVNLWKIPLALSLGAVVFFFCTYSIDRLDYQGVLKLPLWLHFGGIDDCRALLGALMGAVSTVLALIFSVALLVLSMVATLFGPRLLARFIQDPVTQITIGLFMASFVHILLTFMVEQQEGNIVFIPQLTIMGCWLLVLVSFSSLVYYSHRIATSIQNPDMIARVVDDIDAALFKNHQVDRGQPGGKTVEGEVHPVLCLQSGYFQEILFEPLLALAVRHNLYVELRFRPGQFVLKGELLAEVRGPMVSGAIRKTMRIGRHRVLRQDIEFGLFQIVEIAIRALSPAVNDTFTGVASVDWLGDALLLILETPVQDGCWYDRNGCLRVRHPELQFTRLSRLAFDQIRQASVDNPAVLIRLLSTIKRLACCLREECERTALAAQTQAIWDTARVGKLVTLDLEDVERAWQSTCQALQG